MFLESCDLRVKISTFIFLSSCYVCDICYVIHVHYYYQTQITLDSWWQTRCEPYSLEGNFCEGPIKPPEPSASSDFLATLEGYEQRRTWASAVGSDTLGLKQVVKLHLNLSDLWFLYVCMWTLGLISCRSLWTLNIFMIHNSSWDIQSLWEPLDWQ